MNELTALRCFYPDDLKREWSYHLSRPPQSRAEFDQARQFILGHFTSSTFLDRIPKEGLAPDTKKERVIDDNLPSDPESVYLLATFDRFYLHRAIKHHGGRGIMIEVAVERRQLTADEGQINPFVRSTVDAEEALYLSLCGGACKHRGGVAVKNILSIHDMDGTQLYARERITDL